MNYQTTVDYLFQCTPVFEHVGASAYKEGLDNMLALDEHFDHPHTHFKIIHVAGTNGKGSCSHTIAAVLQSMGYKVGLYTSPHLVDFRERIRINGKKITKQYVVDFVAAEKDFFEPLHPSFFELTTALAFKYFAEQHIDIAVIEVGLGGRLDSTNIITPILSVITNISKDHTRFLGSTLSDIASEKAGIIKYGIPVVIGEAVEETRSVFEAKARSMDAPIIFAEDDPLVQSATHTSEGTIVYQTNLFGEIVGQLGGEYQIKNTNTILCSLHAMKIDNLQAIREGFLHVCELTGLMGRWHKLRNKPLVVCDTGHNIGGWNYLAQQIKNQPCNQLHIVFGMVDDKDVDSVMELLPPNALFYWVQPNTHRAIPKEIIASKGLVHGLRGKTYNNVQTAYKTAICNAAIEDFVFIGGSSYVVADLFTYLYQKHEV